MDLKGDYILIQADKAEEKKGELYISEANKTFPPTGVVLGIGPDVRRCKVGDRVFFLRYTAIEGLDKGERICKEEHIIGVING